MVSVPIQARYPAGLPLATIFVHPSLIDVLDAAVEEAIERGSWYGTHFCPIALLIKSDFSSVINELYADAFV